MSLRQCNFCLYRDAKKLAESTNQSIEVKPKPIKGFPDGVDVFIGGTWAMWFAKLPEECAC